MSLSEYQLQAATLTHDEGYAFTTKAQWTRYINLARTACARQTGCVMRLISGQSAFGAGAQPGSMIPGGAQPGALPGADPNAQFSTTTNSFQAYTGIERYPFVNGANDYLSRQHAGCAQIIDVASVSVSWGGSTRPTLQWLPWEDLQAYMRSYNLPTTSWPAVWSVLNPGQNGELWLYPIPSQACEMEWLVYAIPAPLYTDDDYDAIPDGMKNCIQFGAAQYAYMAKEKYAQAEIMGGLYLQHMGVTTAANDRGKIVNPYATAFS